MNQFWEIFTLVTGVIYLVLEVKQKNFMWVVGVLTSLAAMYVFLKEHIYAQVLLNTYYFLVSFWGLWQWRRDSRRILETSAAKSSDTVVQSTGIDTKSSDIANEGGDKIHLNRLSTKNMIISGIVFIVGTFLLNQILIHLPSIGLPAETMSLTDSAITVMSAIATWWLACSYKEQWYLWIVADAALMVMCAINGMWPMTILYGAYSITAIYGAWHWYKHGIYVD